jgi:hypothetical protein
MSLALRNQAFAHTGVDEGIVTIGFVEQKLTDRRWCPYCAEFRNLEDFSAQQRLQPPRMRYCLRETSAAIRADKTMVGFLTVEQKKAQCRSMGLTIKGLNDQEVIEPASRRGSRNNGATADAAGSGSGEPRAEKAGPPKKKWTAQRREQRAAKKQKPNGAKRTQLVVYDKKKGKQLVAEAEEEEERPDHSVDGVADWLCSKLHSLNQLDEKNTIDERDDGKGDIVHMDNFSNNLEWATALDVVSMPPLDCTP